MDMVFNICFIECTIRRIRKVKLQWTLDHGDHGQIQPAEKSILFNSGIFKCFTTLEKNEFRFLAFSSSLVIILSSFINIIFSEDFTLSDKRDFNFENLLFYHKHFFMRGEDMSRVLSHIFRNQLTPLLLLLKFSNDNLVIFASQIFHRKICSSC